METFLGRYKNVLVLMAVLLLQFIGLAVQVRSRAVSTEESKGAHVLRHWTVALVAPPEKAIVHTGADARGFWGNYLDLRHTREENEQLRDEINRLRLEQAGMEEDARQGQRLQALLAFKQQYVDRTVPAQVIGTAGSDQSRVLYIDKGARDGLVMDQPVITPDGIVGRIKEVFPHTSQVLEINDQSSGAGVLLEKTRLRGVLRGNAYGQPQVIDILPDERIKPGEQVLTSGGDQIFPRGLPVGTVEKVVADPEREPYVDIVLKPAANLAHLEEVLVVTGTSDTVPAKTQKDMARSQAVAGVEAEQQRASDILADKLPGLTDPNEPETDQAEQKPTGGEEVGRPIQPPPALHADRFSPNAAPPASSLSPGRAPVVVMAATHGADTASATPKAQHRVNSTGQAAALSGSTGVDGKPAADTHNPAARPLANPSAPLRSQTAGLASGTAPKPAARTAAAANTTPKAPIAVSGRETPGMLAANGVQSANPAIHSAKSLPAVGAGTRTANGVVHTTVLDGPETSGKATRPLAANKVVNTEGTGKVPVRSAARNYVEPKWVGKPPAPEGQPQ